MTQFGFDGTLILPMAGRPIVRGFTLMKQAKQYKNKHANT